MPIVKTEPEKPLMCAVCGCEWEAGKKPHDDCPEVTCPCHHLWIQGLDELAKRYLWGDR